MDASESELQDTSPLVSDKLPLTSLLEEFANHENFRKNTQQLLSQGYTHLRRCRRDGNCFFRAFAFAYLERLLFLESTTEARSLVKENFDLISKYFPPLVFEDFNDVFLEAFGHIDSGDLASVAQFLSDASMSDSIVSLLRFTTAAEILSNPDTYQPFLPDGNTAESFTQNEVLNMGRESEEVHLVALSKRMRTNLRVVYLDASSHDVVHHDFFHNDAINEPELLILYRPGHYDVLYRTL